MADRSDQQLALAQLLAELASQRQNPTPIPQPPPQRDTLDQALVQMAEAMAVMYSGRRS